MGAAKHHSPQKEIIISLFEQPMRPEAPEAPDQYN
jgi:hypothetical protein